MNASNLRERTAETMASRQRSNPPDSGLLFFARDDGFGGSCGVRQLIREPRIHQQSQNQAPLGSASAPACGRHRISTSLCISGVIRQFSSTLLTESSTASFFIPSLANRHRRHLRWMCHRVFACLLLQIQHQLREVRLLRRGVTMRRHDHVQAAHRGGVRIFNDLADAGCQATGQGQVRRRHRHQHRRAPALPASR